MLLYTWYIVVVFGECFCFQLILIINVVMMSTLCESNNKWHIFSINFVSFNLELPDGL